MKKGFYTIMSAQFFSSLADNALFVGAVKLLQESDAPGWQEAGLVPMFALFYVLLAPFVGPFADAFPKGRVMFISNLIKVVGCLMMLCGAHPMVAYAVVGLGAAAYSPAKYGILTELLPSSQLVKANGWIEGLTIASIILGVVLGGLLLGPKLSSMIIGLDVPWVDLPMTTAPEAALSAIICFYILAALFNLRIPLTGAPIQPLSQNPVRMVADFFRCNTLLWRDKLGQISLATTTLFWGVSGNMRYIVLAWAAAALSYSTESASALVGVVAIGTAAGAVLASVRMRLDQALGLIPLGIAMGVLVLALNFCTSITLAIPVLIVLGALGGFLVVPMNALLQHRGHKLMGAGRSIAVQNFNEQLCILLLGALNAGLTQHGWSAFSVITTFGLLVATVMCVIKLWHQRNLRRHPDEVGRLLQIARGDQNS
jgi:MFS family permease